MKVKSLSDIYTSLEIDKGTVYVVPKIRYDHSDSDYLYNLYKPLLNHQDFKVRSLSIFGHYKFVLNAILQRRGILHYHWLEFQDLRSLLGMPWKLLCIYLFNLFGGSIVWTIHNLEPHDGKWLSLHLKMHCWMGRIADCVHIHCVTSSEEIENKFNIPQAKLSLHPHPSYPAKQVDKETAIEFLNHQFDINLNREKPILLIFGNISEYKKIENVLDIIKDEELNIQTIIAGPVKKGQEELGDRLSERSKKDSDIQFLPYFIKDTDIPYFFGATDFCFFNYTQILTSGSVIMAHSYQKKIIAPEIGCLVELIKEENVYLFSSEAEKKELLRSLISTLSNE